MGGIAAIEQTQYRIRKRMGDVGCSQCRTDRAQNYSYRRESVLLITKPEINTLSRVPTMPRVERLARPLIGTRLEVDMTIRVVDTNPRVRANLKRRSHFPRPLRN